MRTRRKHRKGWALRPHYGTKKGAGKGCFGSRWLTDTERELTRTAWKRHRIGRRHGRRGLETYAGYRQRILWGREYAKKQRA